MEGQPFIQIRGISNAVGERDKNRWKMDDALNNTADFILNWYGQFS
jgi:nucleoside phosphorylase